MTAILHTHSSGIYFIIKINLWYYEISTTVVANSKAPSVFDKLNLFLPCPGIVVKQNIVLHKDHSE